MAEHKDENEQIEGIPTLIEITKRVVERDSRSIKELIEDALAQWDGPWTATAIATLQFRGSQEVLNSAKTLCSSQIAKERCVGASILGLLGIPERAFPDECLDVLLGMLERETDIDVLESVCLALGHLNHAGAIPSLVDLRHHPSERIRYALAEGLEGSEDERVIAMMIELAEDPNESVRESVMENLALIEIDSPAIRETLFKRLNDELKSIQNHALEGLVRRQDRRIVGLAIDKLISGDVAFGLLEALICKMLTEIRDEIVDERLPEILQRCKEVESG